MNYPKDMVFTAGILDCPVALILIVSPSASASLMMAGAEPQPVSDAAAASNSDPDFWKAALLQKEAKLARIEAEAVEVRQDIAWLRKRMRAAIVLRMQQAYGVPDSQEMEEMQAVEDLAEEIRAEPEDLRPPCPVAGSPRRTRRKCPPNKCRACFNEEGPSGKAGVAHKWDETCSKTKGKAKRGHRGNGGWQGEAGQERGGADAEKDEEEGSEIARDQEGDPADAGSGS